MVRSNFNNKIFVYLASQSPRRMELLNQLGITCEMLPTCIDETQLKNETPEQYVKRLAKEKAQTCVFRLTDVQKNYPILAADTTVTIEGKVLGKPDNDLDAIKMLNSLSGRQHQVHTAVALAFNNKIEVVLSTTSVEMMELTQKQIMFYVETGEPHDKAGSYGIQGLAGAWIKRIDGSYSGVMGLPLYETSALLRKYGIGTF